ncbi:hypothetical protein SUGI_0171600 [Cryptomeria japonica]|uniref:transcription factor MYB1 n=1 Tax=Cryptomeria japonica TaxID=3369 RepID=UPI002408E659|nr:transcription factor MYB1 [Cryptomeria japonica]GLJ11572.1 hypothetical protein SUGI_0171600 [Cryptomeria japonica]
MGRRPFSSKQEDLNRGSWTAEEDRILTNYIHTHGEIGWRSLPKKAGLNRCGKSCRLRWLNYLRPDIKRGNISADEDELIIRMHRLLGNRWALIAGRLPGRTDNEIKNYWNTHLSKKLAMSSSRAIDSTAHIPLRKAASFSGMKRQSQLIEDNGTKPCEMRCGSDNEEQALDEIKSWTQLLQESLMANPAEDTQEDENNISSSKLNVSYPLDCCNLFSLSCNDLRIGEDFSVENLVQPGDYGVEDICSLQDTPHEPSDNVDRAKCFGIPEIYNTLQGKETRQMELPPLEQLFEWEDHVNFSSLTTTYQEEYLDNLVDIPNQKLVS